MVSTRKLQDHNWADIEEQASAYIQTIEISLDEGHREAPCGVSTSMHANINIDW